MNDFDFENRYLSLEPFFYDEDSFITFKKNNLNYILKKSVNSYSCILNKCAHRGMLLESRPLGKGRLNCKYHNWIYDNKGVLLNKTPFNDGNIKISSFEANVNENLVFCGELDSTELESCLSFLDITLDTNVFYSDCLSHGSNWKWLVENVLESYHISSVHASTFLPAGFKHTKYVKEYKFGKSSGLYLPKYRDERGFYKHVFVWPNLFISNTSDLVTFVSFINPVTTSKTDLQWYILPGKKAKKLPINVMNSLLEDSVNFTKNVLNEDKDIVELQQKGAGSDYHHGILTGIEKRLQWFWECMNV